MNRKTLLLTLLTCILLLAGCRQDTAAAPAATAEETAETSGTTAAATSEETTEASETTAATTAEETTEIPETTAAATSEETTKAPETAAAEPESSEETEEPDVTEANADEPVSDDEQPFGEVILEENVPASFMDAFNRMKDIYDSGKFTYTAETTLDYGDYERTMYAVIALDSELGQYMDIDLTDIDLQFMMMKNIFRPDDSIIMIDDGSKRYVKTTHEESGMTMTNLTYDADSVLIPVKEDITTADLVRLPSGEELYRFTVTPENNASDTEYSSDIYMYFDTDGSIKRMALDEGYYEARMTLDMHEGVDEALFEIPSDYEEITYEEYRKILMESLGLGGLTSE